MTFIDNNASGYQYNATECIVQSTRAAVTIFINSSHFQGQQTRLFTIRGSNISLFIHNSSFIGYGPAYGNGGVVYLSGPDHPEQRTMFKVGVSNSTFVNTSAAQGGAIDVEAINACNITFRDSIFTGNTALAGEGGAVFIGSSGPVFHDDKNPTNRTFGEALSVTEPDGCYITIERSTFSNNVASSNGGAVSVSANSPATIILQNVTMESNKAKNFGGAMYVSDSGNGEGETFRPRELPNFCNITVVLSVFSKNYALSHNGTTGGAIFISGEKPTVLILANVTMEENGAQHSGGAVHVDTVLSALKVYESFFYNNTAIGPRDAVGGAISIINVRNYSGTPNLTVEHSTFSNNKATHSGGAVYLSANAPTELPNFCNITVVLSVFLKNYALSHNGSGGAIFISGEKPTVLILANVTMEGNGAQHSGGAVHVDTVLSALKVYESFFYNNTALGPRDAVGGAISIINVRSYSGTPNLTVEHSTFSNNKATHSGGAVYLSANAPTELPNFCNITVVLSVFSKNYALSQNGSGGAIFISGEKPTVLILANVTMEGNGAQHSGGAVHVDTVLSALKVYESFFYNNTAIGPRDAVGGAISIMNVRNYSGTPNLTVEHSTFSNNKATHSGGAVYLHANVPTELPNFCNITVVLSVFSKNYALSHNGTTGGAIFISGEKPTVLILANVTMEGNGAQHSGGAVHVDTVLSALKVYESFFYNNTAIGPRDAVGGAISIINVRNYSGTPNLTVEHSTFSNNKATHSGGAVYLHANAPTELPNFCNITVVLSVFSKNYALSHNGSGGAIFISGEKPTVLILANVTMEGNGAQHSGGAVHVDTVLSALKVYESFFYNNTAIVSRDAAGGAIRIKNVRNYSGTPNLTVEHSTFSNNKATHSGGAFYLRANEKSVLRLSNLTMESNTVEVCGGAIVVHLIHAITIHNSEFLDNTALSSLGAALSVDDSTFSSCSSKQVGGAFYLWAEGMATVEVKRSRFVGNHAFKYYGGAAAILVNQENRGGASPLLFEDTTFEENAAVLGGAVHLSNGNATFQNCTFLNNFVQVLGGHIHTDFQSTNLFIWDCVFNQTLFKPGNENYSVGAFFIKTQSKGSLNIQNTSLTANYPGNRDVLIRKTNGREVNLDNLTTLTCPVGSQIKVLYFQIKFEPQTTLTILEVQCLACEGNTYSLNRGRAFGLQEGPEFHCLSCPYGAKCTQNIVAEPNFWGFKYNPSTLKFITCPYGYCSSPHEADFPEYDSCQGNRSGTMCGHCKESHTETLYSASCAPSSECKDHWIWPVALIYVSMMALLFTFKPPIVPWIKRQILWFQKHDPANQDEEFDRGYLKIVFYFYQAANLLLVSDSTLHILKTEVWEPVIGLFNFQQNISPVSTTGVICPFPGLNAVTKRLLLASPVFGTMLMIAVFYMLHWGSKKIQCREAPPVGPYIGGILQTTLLGYATMASVSFDLLTCVPIRSEKRLFYDGNIACFQPWQFLFVAFVFGFFVPFLFVLMWGSFKLYRGTASVANFLLACCLPLPILLYWAYIALIYRAPPLVRLGEQPAGQMSTKISVERVLYDPFKRPEEGSKFSLSWEGVMIAWRLILIVLNAFIDDPLSRLLVMTSFCVLFLLLHCIAQPFRDGIANTVETISLLCVVQLGIINTFFASFHSLGVPLRGSNPLISWASAFEIIEIIILGFVPAVACLFVVAAVLSQGGRLLVVLYQTIRHLARLCYNWRFRKQENEEAPLLV